MLISDVTLRDGMHFWNHNTNLDFIASYAKFAEQSGIDVLEVANGWGYNSRKSPLNINELDMIKTARKHLKKTKLSIHLNPDFCTLEDFNKVEKYVDIVRISTTPNDVEKMKQFRCIDKELWACIMFSSSVSLRELELAILKIKEMNFETCVLFDSAGTYRPEDVKTRVDMVKSHKLRVGFHGHNNLQLAVINSMTPGIDIVDVTMNGIGSGAGNVPAEIFVNLVDCNVDTDLVFKMSEEINMFPTRTIQNIKNAVNNIAPLFTVVDTSGQNQVDI
jgi:4-hydroxy 2-oxovalerate aldolase